MAIRPIWQTSNWHDPDMLQIAQDMRTSKMSVKSMSDQTGISSTTIYNWMNKKTRQPTHCRLRAALNALGKDYAIVELKGKVIPLRRV